MANLQQGRTDADDIRSSHHYTSIRIGSDVVLLRHKFWFRV
jgi:hypothetical protein